MIARLRRRHRRLVVVVLVLLLVAAALALTSAPLDPVMETLPATAAGRMTP